MPGQIKKEGGSIYHVSEVTRGRGWEGGGLGGPSDRALLRLINGSGVCSTCLPGGHMTGGHARGLHPPCAASKQRKSAALQEIPSLGLLPSDKTVALGGYLLFVMPGLNIFFCLVHGGRKC